MPNDCGYQNQSGQNGNHFLKSPIYSLGFAALLGCAATLQSGEIAERNLELFRLAQGKFLETRYSLSTGIETHVAIYVDRSAHNQKMNSRTPLTQQDIVVTIEAAASQETGTPVSLRIDADHNGRFFDAGVDGLHHALEPGYHPKLPASVDTLVMPAGSGRKKLDFDSNDPKDLEALAEAQRAANRFVTETRDAIQRGAIVPANSREFK